MNENIRLFTEQSKIEKQFVTWMIHKLAIRIKGVCLLCLGTKKCCEKLKNRKSAQQIYPTTLQVLCAAN